MQHSQPTSLQQGDQNPQSKLAAAWERLIATRALDEEVARLGRLFNTLMMISTGIIIALSAVFLLMQPLGLLSATVSWIAAAFPLAFIPLSLFCLVRSRRGHVQPTVRLYTWVNLVAIGAAAWLFDGIYSPAWPLFIWTITVAGSLLAPEYALWLTGGAVVYFEMLLLATEWGLYSPLLSFGRAGREFVHISVILIMLVSTVGLLTYLNMRSLREALDKLRDEIAVRKRAEEGLRQSEERYRNLFSNAEDIIFTMAADGAYTSLNPAFEKVLGWPVLDWLGKPFASLIPLEDQPKAVTAFQKALEGEFVGRFELAVRKKDGSRFVGEFTVAPLRQGDARILLCICRDITQRKQFEEALSESERKFRAIFDSATDGIFTTDLEGKFTTINPAVQQLLGWSPRELLGTRFAQWVHPDDLSHVNEVFLKVLSGQPCAVETRAKSKSGEYRLLDVAGTPWIEHGRLVGALGFYRDITERRRMEEEIRKFNEELELKVQQRTRQLLAAHEELVRKEKLAVLGQVAGSVGHELRNPLGVINNAVYFLENVLSGADESVKEYLNIIRNEIASSERIVSDLLDSVRTKPPHPETVGVRELIDQTLKRCSVPPSVDVILDVPADLPPLRVDALQISQVLSNLVSNGVEAMPGGGNLQIAAKGDKAAKMVSISVRDSGTGIAPEQMGKLFQPLFTTKARGIGLGLVVVKNLTEANGGRVEVHSELGRGAVFVVTLPSAG